MNKEDIDRMAREADCQHVDITGDHAKAVERLERFAALVAAAVCEECAQICENLDMAEGQGDCWDIGTLDCADAIRKAIKK
jgi:hypothetical protein